MRTVELLAPRVMELAERPMEPDPGPGEVLVRLRAVGLCGSDLHWYEDGGISQFDAVYPMILGHEPVGEVVALGPGVETHKIGTKVAVEPSIVCGHCEYCLSGRPNNCPEGVFMGGLQKPGFFRDYAVVPARNAEIFPQDMDFLTATLIEPVAVIVHVFELAPVRVGDTVAVFGAGPIGLLTATMAKLAGAAKIILADRVPHRLRLGRQMDCAHVFVDTNQSKLADAVLEATGGKGVDIVFDAASGPETIQAGIEVAKPSGQYVMIGIPPRKTPLLDIHTAMHKELRIQTIKRSNLRGHQAIALIQAGRIPDSLITHRLPLENTPEGFELVSHYRDGVGKLVIELN
jgi:L-iditol 2-dehydrogenase